MFYKLSKIFTLFFITMCLSTQVMKSMRPEESKEFDGEKPKESEGNNTLSQLSSIHHTQRGIAISWMTEIAALGLPPLHELSSAVQKKRWDAQPIDEETSCLFRPYFKDGDIRKFYGFSNGDQTIISTPSKPMDCGFGPKTINSYMFPGVTIINQKIWNQLTHEQRIKLLQKENHNVNHLQLPYIKALTATAASAATSTATIWTAKNIWKKYNLSNKKVNPKVATFVFALCAGACLGSVKLATRPLSHYAVNYTLQSN